uniref:Pre-rRNA-processing protein TSR2 homolog n=1 Tax=Cacopsylla melanoneura TaxID=428564 RepID=A0A8D8Q0J2_9HEMI
MELLTDFKTVVSTVLNNWIGLKMALENGMGGPPSVSRQKLLTLIESVSDILVHTKNPNTIEWEIIADTLADFLDDQMDTVFEDNSPDEVAVQIVDLFKLFILPDQTNLMNAINQMKYSTPIVSDVLHVNVPVVEDDEDMATDSEDEPTPEEADGWTVVKKK